MNTILSVLVVLAMMLHSSCEDLVRFEEPQPTGKPGISHFPKKLMGNYFSTSDSAWLTINDYNIVEWVDAEFRTIWDSLDLDELEIDTTGITDNYGSFKMEGFHIYLNIRYENDSVFGKYSYRDTIFHISDHEVLKRFKGHYFLNYKQHENDWQVRMLSLRKDTLTFAKIKGPEDIEDIKEITQVKEIRSGTKKIISYQLNPTKKELKKLLEISFKDTKKYRRVD